MQPRTGSDNIDVESIGFSVMRHCDCRHIGLCRNSEYWNINFPLLLPTHILLKMEMNTKKRQPGDRAVSRKR